MICSTHDLNEKVCACTEAFSAKIDGSNGKRAVVLCGGTGCLSSNSAEIRHRFEQLVVERGLSEKVTVNQVGCFGLCGAAIGNLFNRIYKVACFTFFANVLIRYFCVLRI